jgi:hypothetical protein
VVLVLSVTSHFSWASCCLLGGLVVGVSGCSDEDPPPQTVKSGVATGATCPPNSTLTYESWALGFFEDYCLRCHSQELGQGERNGAPLSYNWDDLDRVREHIPEMDLMAAASSTVVNTTMPLSAPAPPVSERRRLGEWLACGAPE